MVGLASCVLVCLVAGLPGNQKQQSKQQDLPTTTAKTWLALLTRVV